MLIFSQVSGSYLRLQLFDLATKKVSTPMAPQPSEITSEADLPIDLQTYLPHKNDCRTDLSQSRVK
jgi:hypothetical protein